MRKINIASTTPRVLATLAVTGLLAGGVSIGVASAQPTDMAQASTSSVTTATNSVVTTTNVPQGVRYVIIDGVRYNNPKVRYSVANGVRYSVIDGVRYNSTKDSKVRYATIDGVRYVIVEVRYS